MVRFYSSVYSDDKMLIREMSCDSVFHGNFPTQIAAAHRTKTECLGSVPTTGRVVQFVSEIRSFPRNAVTFEVGVVLYAVLLTILRVAKSLECKPDQSGFTF